LNTDVRSTRRGICRADILWIALLVMGASGPGQSAVSLTNTAQDLVTGLMQGDAAAILSRARPRVRQELSVAQLKLAVAGLQATAGAFNSQVSSRHEKAQGFDVVIVTCEFERAMVDIQLVFDAHQRIAGLNLRPAATTQHYSSPAYVEPESFRNQDIVVDADGWPLPGTVAIPNGEGPVPLIVLVYGSGPSDRDATFGPNKVFKDLAEGLASHGVAALRFEKRTFAHAARIAAPTEFTPNDELIDDALATVVLARTLPMIDGKRGYVLGHSLGGTLAPRIAQADPLLAGIIVMAGAVRSMEQSIVDQRAISLSSMVRSMRVSASDGSRTDPAHPRAAGGAGLSGNHCRLRSMEVSTA